jgi:hypothetical protein
MIAATTTAKTRTSFQEIFFNDLFPLIVIDLPAGGRRAGHCHHTKAPENLLKAALSSPVGVCPAEVLLHITVNRVRHLTKLFGAQVIKP